MSEIKAIEKLRDYANEHIINGPLMNAMIDEIEREIEASYMQLPLDADGVPIRIGDELCLSKLTRGEVSALMLTPDGWEWELEGDDWYDVRFTSHVKPDPVKELLKELMERAYTIEKVDSAPHPVVDECDIDEIAARIREAVEK